MGSFPDMYNDAFEKYHSTLEKVHFECQMNVFSTKVVFGDTLGAFHSTEIPVGNFGNCTCAVKLYIPVAQTRPKSSRVWLLFL